jgi:hypothetical protein
LLIESPSTCGNPATAKSIRQANILVDTTIRLAYSFSVGREQPTTSKPETGND